MIGFWCSKADLANSAPRQIFARLGFVGVRQRLAVIHQFDNHGIFFTPNRPVKDISATKNGREYCISIFHFSIA